MTTVIVLFLVVVLWSLIVPKDAKPADSSATARTEPTVTAEAPDVDEDPDADAAGAVSPITSVAAIPNDLCRLGDPLTNVYHPARLHVVDACRTVSGTVDKVRTEDDGDYHINLKLDAPFASPVNRQNIAKENGDLVVEVVPADRIGCTPGQSPNHSTGDYDYGICTGANVAAPAKDDHVQVVGPYVLDTAHGWMEIHPAWAIVKTGDMALTAPLPGGDAAPAASLPPGAALTTTTFVQPPAAAPTTAFVLPTTAFVAPTTTAAAGNVVHGGAFCSPLGATGVTSAGSAMVCSTTPQDSKARWRSA